jgi:hypothetical protein
MAASYAQERLPSPSWAPLKGYKSGKVYKSNAKTVNFTVTFGQAGRSGPARPAPARVRRHADLQGDDSPAIIVPRRSVFQQTLWHGLLGHGSISLTQDSGINYKDRQ